MVEQLRQLLREQLSLLQAGNGDSPRPRIDQDWQLCGLRITSTEMKHGSQMTCPIIQALTEEERLSISFYRRLTTGFAEPGRGSCSRPQNT